MSKTYNIKSHEVVDFFSDFARRSYDKDKYVELEPKKGAEVEITIAFRTMVHGKSANAGEKVSVNRRDFRALALSGYIREVLFDDHIATIDKYIAKRFGKVEAVEKTTEHKHTKHKHKSKAKPSDESSE